MKKLFHCFTVVLLFCVPLITAAQHVPLGQEQLVSRLDQELSGESAKRNLEYISRLHRMRGSEGYNQAINFIEEKLKDYDLEAIELIDIPVDGIQMYGTQQSRPAWNVQFAELWEQEKKNGIWINHRKIADWESIPLVVAQDSKSGEVSAALVDIGSGTKESDYTGKNIEGNLVLTSSQPESVAALAIEKYHASGIISYAQNQPSAWYGENENLIRWGHFDYFANTHSFAFMVSLKQARAFLGRLSKGENIQLYAKVLADTSPGNWKILTAVIQGTDPELKDEEILFTCHLDHPRPGANDNASGCVAILEVARTLKKLINEGKMDRPKRTIRFLWSPEIEGTTALLNFRPEFAQRTKFNIHMDMVGGGPVTKGIYQVSRGPQSVPSFMNSIGESFGEFLNQSSRAYSSGDPVRFPVVSQEGGKEPLQAVLGNFHMGSDFQVFSEGSFKIPSIYLHQYPDRYIHTNFDRPENIDPTVLKRSAFLGAASGYYLADFDQNDVKEMIALIKQQLLNRAYKMMMFCDNLSAEEQENAKYYFWLQEKEAFYSMKPFVDLNPEIEKDFMNYVKNLQKGIGQGHPMVQEGKSHMKVYKRNENVKGGMVDFSYNYFTEHYGSEKKFPAIFGYAGIRGKGGEYSYEALNLVDGKNSVGDIRNMLSAEFGPIPESYVNEYLRALESIGVIQGN